VALLDERSVHFEPESSTPEALLAPHSGGKPSATALSACVQCGACSASCELFDRGVLVPRRQMTLLAQGNHRELLWDVGPWQCQDCQNCTVHCPAGAMPGRIMAIVRQLAVQGFAFPRFMARSTSSHLQFSLLVAGCVVILLVSIWTGGSFAPNSEQVIYSSLLSHNTICLLFCTLTALVMGAMLESARRAWHAFNGRPSYSAGPVAVARALGRAMLASLLSPRTNPSCHRHKPRSWAHLALVHGLGGLLLVAAAVAVLLWTGNSYPLRALHPLKILGNGFAVLTIAASAYFWWRRWQCARRGEPSNLFDWLLPTNLLAASVTGVATELLRYLNQPALAYPAYFLHLLTVFVLLASLPYSKLAHVVYRTVAAAQEPAVRPQPGQVAPKRLRAPELSVPTRTELAPECR
jgi:quinone-modifying oxidoreductase subunit QmoC